MNIVAIDPGASGGMAFWFDGILTVHPMPITEGDVCGQLKFFIGFPTNTPPTIVYLEQVGGFIKGGEKSSPGSAMFNFGRNYGFILGCCAALGVRVELVTPQKWQKAFPVGMAKGVERKRALKAIAQRLYPTEKVTLKTCDALLILDWAKQNNTEGLPR